ncbi:hypothetical protein [Paracoccus actinidiae]|jgi:hypothetical protein|uniref:hypothetical protein n=1 Tax=Paracoccus actinidiae TaxID=3064531 RepID=UPI0027D2B3B6|nr:hypothetical protein [Paracoccus sp. M09]
MKIKTLTAPIALAAVLGFGPAAFAQNMVGTQQVTEADMAAVAEHCRTLAMGSDDQAAGATAAGGDAGNSGNADNDSVSSTGGPDADAGTMDGAQPTTGNEGNQDDDAPNPNAIASTAGPASGTTGVEGNQDADQFSGTINMEVITLADCQAAGM